MSAEPDHLTTDYGPAYMPQLDAIRAIAVSTIMLHHFGPQTIDELLPNGPRDDFSDDRDRLGGTLVGRNGRADQPFQRTSDVRRTVSWMIRQWPWYPA